MKGEAWTGRILVAQVPEALLGRHDVAKLIPLRQRALNGRSMVTLLAPACIDTNLFASLSPLLSACWP